MQQELLILDRPTGPEMFFDQAPEPEIHDDGVIADRITRTVSSRFQECPVCFGRHEEQIHEATLSVRQWFREEVTKSFRVVFSE